jgi:hypothetical protein
MKMGKPQDGVEVQMFPLKRQVSTVLLNFTYSVQEYINDTVFHIYQKSL